MTHNAVAASACCCVCGPPTCDSSCLDVSTDITSTISHVISGTKKSFFCEGGEVFSVRDQTLEHNFTGLGRSSISYIVGQTSNPKVREYRTPSGNPYSERRFFGGATISASGSGSASVEYDLDTWVVNATTSLINGEASWTINWELINTDASNYFATGDYLFKHVKGLENDCDGDSVCTTTFTQGEPGDLKVQVKQTLSASFSSQTFVADENVEEWVGQTPVEVTFNDVTIIEVPFWMIFRYEEDLKDCEQIPNASSGRVLSSASLRLAQLADSAYDRIQSEWINSAAGGAYPDISFDFDPPFNTGNPVEEDSCEPFDQDSSGQQGLLIGRSQEIGARSINQTCTESGPKVQENTSYNLTTTIRHDNTYPMEPVPCP